MDKTRTKILTTIETRLSLLKLLFTVGGRENPTYARDADLLGTSTVLLITYSLTVPP